MPAHRCPQQDRKFSSRWWSVELPSDWSASEDCDCVTFRSRSRADTLKASATRKPDGVIVVADLDDFIEGPRASAIAAERYFGFNRKACLMAGSGLSGDSFAGPVLVYCTYTSAAGAEMSEIDQVRQIVESVCIEDGLTSVGKGASAEIPGE